MDINGISGNTWAIIRNLYILLYKYKFIIHGF